MTESEIVLYIWPGQWGLHSFEPMCLATVIFLQLSIPGKFSVVECTNPELSPTGRSVLQAKEHPSNNDFFLRNSALYFPPTTRRGDFVGYNEVRYGVA